MRRQRRVQFRNKLDLTDRSQVRVVARRFRLSERELTHIAGRIGNSIAAIGKEVAIQRARQLPGADADQVSTAVIVASTATKRDPAADTIS